MQISILDTTLRDGQQAPGAGISLAQHLEYVQIAIEIGVDIIEVGYPSASQYDFLCVNTIAKEYRLSSEIPIISALSTLSDDQFEITQEALSPLLPYQKARIHFFLPIDPLYLSELRHPWVKESGLLLNHISHTISLAIKAGFETQFSLMGYSRLESNFDLATDIFSAAIHAGCSIVNCADSIGGACWLQGKDYFVNNMNCHAKILKKEFPNKKLTWSVHCHNDYGLALENTMNAVFLGPATQIEGCINGIGERAGNVALEQCALYIHEFGKLHKKKCYTNLNLKKLKKISDFVATNMLPRQAHWPIVGENIAKHTSGIHTAAILKDKNAFQPFDPSLVDEEVRLTFGPLSGSHHIQFILHKYGFFLDDDEKKLFLKVIKNLYAEKRKGISDEEIVEAFLSWCQCRAQ